MGNNRMFKLRLSGLDCANCANKIEERVNRLELVEEANLNFSTSQLTVFIKESAFKNEVIDAIKQIVKQLEPHVIVEENQHLIEKRKSHCCQGACSPSTESPKSLDVSKVFNLIKEDVGLWTGVILFLIVIIFNPTAMQAILLYGLSYLCIGRKVLSKAFLNLSRGEFFDENFLMMIATIGAFVIGEYPEAIAVMLFYEIGEIFQSYAVNRSRQSISSLLDIRADHANLVTDSGMQEVSPEVVSINDMIMIKPGERVPLDGEVVEGECYLDTSALTGESVPRLVTVGEEILAGCINTNAVIKVRVTKLVNESTVARILELVENASSKKAKTEKFITKFARIYTPIVVCVAILIAIIPTFIFQADFSTWLYRALSFLVVSCPCALVVSIPLGFFAGLGGAS
ncbi:MAG: heavy metal translocating P-type ATPase, partial [Turicibacter sp.]|nr:heavy metal translocating P-type ATPase [Turicibacter sp.]